MASIEHKLDIVSRFQQTIHQPPLENSSKSMILPLNLITESLLLCCSLFADATRLVNGTDTCSGRLQVKPNLEWLSVCAEGFTEQSVQVVCQELGCGVLSVMTRVFTEQIETPMWKSQFHCQGNESSLKDCRKSPRERTSCFPGEAVWLQCSGTPLAQAMSPHLCLLKSGLHLINVIHLHLFRSLRISFGGRNKPVQWWSSAQA